MRILHCVHDYLPQQVAGVEVYTSRLLAGQRAHDDVALLGARLDPGRRSGALEVSSLDGVDFFEVVQNRDWWRFHQTWRDVRLAPAFREVLDRFEPDVLHVQHWMNLTLSLMDVAEERGLPVVMTLHDHWLACANGGQRLRRDRSRCDRLEAGRCASCTATQVGPLLAARGRRQRRRATRAARTASDVTEGSGPGRAGRFTASLQDVFARRAPAPFGSSRIATRWRAMRGLADRVDRFIAPSRFMADAAIEFGLPRDRLEVLPHGLPVGPSVVTRPDRPHARRFGYLGSIVPHKGVHHLVAAFAGMPPDAELSIYGSLRDDPAYVRELRGVASHPGIRLRGELAPDAVPSRLRELDCLVAPSIWAENAPLGVQEALAQGTPVVATDLGGHGELLAQGGGLLVPPGDEPALLAALLRLSRERGLASELAARAPAPRPLDEHLRALREIYEGLVSRPVGSGGPLDAP